MTTTETQQEAMAIIEGYKDLIQSYKIIRRRLSKLVQDQQADADIERLKGEVKRTESALKQASMFCTESQDEIESLQARINELEVSAKEWMGLVVRNAEASEKEIASLTARVERLRGAGQKLKPFLDQIQEARGLTIDENDAWNTFRAALAETEKGIDQ